MCSFLKYYAIIPLLLQLFIGSCKKEPIGITQNFKILSVGTFGGSICEWQTNDAKQIWNDSIRQDSVTLQITTCGVSSMGFSSNTEKNIPWQIQNAKTFDVYILWCSTNDTWAGEIGEIGTTDLTTQSGGLLKSIELIKSRNESAIIVLFTSLPVFSSEEDYASIKKLPQYVDAQKQFCEVYNIPCLDQFSLSRLNINNYDAYYIPDKVHLTNIGYCFVASLQASFLRQVFKNAR